jgi:hypothetical protein
VRRAVDAKALPALKARRTPSGAVSVTLQDADYALVAPMEVGWVAEDGSVRKETLKPGVPLELAPERSGEFLVMDPQDRHISWAQLARDGETLGELGTDIPALLTPSTAAGVAHFLDAGSAAQEPVLARALPLVTPDGFQEFAAALDSDWAKTLAVETACAIAADPGLDPQIAAAWKVLLQKILPVPPVPFVLDSLQDGGYAGCSMFDAETAFADDWTQLKTGLPSGGVSYQRLAFLAAFDIPAPLAMSTWGSVALRSSSARARWLATRRMRLFLDRLDRGDLPAWRRFFVDRLSATEDTDILREAIQASVTTEGPTAADNADALAGLDRVLHSRFTAAVHSRAICAAFNLTQGDVAAWLTFVAAARDAPLRPSAAAYLTDPSRCP